MNIQNDFIQLLVNDEPREVIKDYTSIDFAQLAEYARKHKMESRVLDILSRSGNDNRELNLLRSKDIGLREERADAQYKALDDILECIEQHQYIWIKGIPLSHVIYSDFLARRVGDMDILIPTKLREVVIKHLLNKGYTLVGIVNDEIGLRYTVNYHEVQIESPMGAFIELKEYSGEMGVFYDDEIINSFYLEENTQYIRCGSKRVRTSTPLYTVYHLFLTAISNASTWFFMDDTGFRDLYEIMLAKKNNIFSILQIAEISRKHGVNLLFQLVMQRVNKLFGCVFSEEELQLFDGAEYINEMCKLYLSFYRNMKIDLVDEISKYSCKEAAYFRAIRDTYYSDKLALKEDYLDRELLDYAFQYDNRFLRTEFIVKKAVCEPHASVVFRILNSAKNDIQLYGPFTDVIVDLQMHRGSIKIECYLKRGQEQQRIEYFLSESEKKGKEYASIRLCIPIGWLDRSCNRICYNLQLNVDNPQDDEMFRLTELVPQRNSICVFAAYVLNE